MYIGLYVKYP